MEASYTPVHQTDNPLPNILPFPVLQDRGTRQTPYRLLQTVPVPSVCVRQHPHASAMELQALCRHSLVLLCFPLPLLVSPHIRLAVTRAAQKEVAPGPRTKSGTHTEDKQSKAGPLSLSPSLSCLNALYPPLTVLTVYLYTNQFLPQ